MVMSRCVQVLNSLLKQHAHACSFPPTPAHCLYRSYSRARTQMGPRQHQDSEMNASECVSSHSRVRSSPGGEGDRGPAVVVNVHSCVCAGEPGTRIRTPFPLPLSETLDVALEDREQKVRV